MSQEVMILIALVILVIAIVMMRLYGKPFLSSGFIGRGERTTVKLYFADWCPYCVEFKPMWAALKKKHSGEFDFEEVDLTKSDDKSKMPIPAIYRYNGDLETRFNGKRTEDALLAFFRG